jgi:O-antigen ligase
MTAGWITTIVAAALLFLAPATMLTLRGGAGYCFFLLLAMGLATLVSRRGNRDYTAPLRAYPLYTLGMLAFAVVVPLQQAVDHYYFPKQFDAISRFMLSLPIFLLLCTVPARRQTLVGWGCAGGALGAAAWAFISGIHNTWSEMNRLGNYYTNPIPFGNTALLLGFLALLSIRWDTSHRRLAVVVKVCALLAGCYASYLSGARGGWLALPLLIWLAAANFGWTRHWVRLLIVTGVFVAGVAALPSTHVVQQRLHDTASDFTQLERGNGDTSIGLRLQLWRASMHIFEENPVLGIGKGRLRSALQGLADTGQASQVIVNERAHSEFFSTIAELGVIGVACLALVYWGPLSYFLKHRKSANVMASTAAHCGLAISASTIVFGLSIDVFAAVMNVALVAVLWAAMLAIIHRETHHMDGAAAMPRREPAD